MELKLPIGKDKVEVVVCHPGCRTQAQLDTVAKIVAHPVFDSTVNNPFESEPEGRVFRRPLNFLWFDKEGGLNYTRIGTGGKVLSSGNASGAMRSVI